MTDAREWLEPDGLGGFAMGCVDGIRTRRYHAVLLAATQPPDGRMVLVADLEVFVETAAGARFALSARRYRGEVVDPDGATRQTAFAYAPWPRTEWTLPDGTRVARELIVEPGRARTVVRWTRVGGQGAAKLTVRPLLAPRDYHALHHENGALRFAAEVSGERVTWRPYDGVPAITVRANASYAAEPIWYRAARLSAEAERGLDAEEDLAAPGVLTFDLAAGAAVMVIEAGDGSGDGDVAARAIADGVFAAEAARRAAFASPEPRRHSAALPTRGEPRSSPLVRAADAYIVARGAGQTVIAGYPWFGDWGRDTFISLRGLCLATGRREVAAGILRQWASVVSDGMLPNRFSEHGAPEYNSVDAALWFVIAADAYLAGPHADADRAALEAAIDAIVDGYARGTRHRIGADADGLVACGEPGIQLTWMDAKLGDEVITPRIGKPVEIQALWINALAIAGRRTPRWRDLAARATESFAARFWDAERHQLHDVVDCDHVAGTFDATCRPNQIFAIGGLPLAILDGDRARAVVDTAFAALWTPAGPRSLAPADPRYRGHYGGGPAERDRGYHQGPVWPWLAGAFVEAWVRVRGNTAAVRAEAREHFLAPLHARLELAGLGHLSEICDGDAPHRPVGCPFQAWSMAELLRLELDVLAAGAGTG